MGDEELEAYKTELLDAAVNLQKEIYEALRKALPESSEVNNAWVNFLRTAAKNNDTTRIIIEYPKLKVDIFPVGTGEPMLMMRVKDDFTEKDKEAFHDLGIKLD